MSRHPVRLAVGLCAVLTRTPALAQQSAPAEPLANRIAATTEALSQYRAVDNGVWASGSTSLVNDRRQDLSRKITVRALQFGYDHRIESPFTANDELVLGVAGAVLNSSSKSDAQNLQVDSRGWSVTGYGVYAPYLFLSFPVTVSVGRWNSDQTRDGTPLMPIYGANYDSTSVTSSFGAALTVPVQRLLLTTSLTHRYTKNNRREYTEAINPLATDFQTTPAEITEASQLIGNMRVALPFVGGQVWASVGYANDLKRTPAEDTRSEFPLGLGVDFVTRRWQLGLGGQAILRNDITSYTGSLTGRLQF
jgi:hypothetical protein